MSHRILHGNCLELLFSDQLPAEWFHMVCTSPPYFGLRNYGLPPTVWGGDPACAHVWGDVIRSPWANSMRGPNGVVKNTGANGTQRPGKTSGQFCQQCDAWFGCLGNEPGPQLFTRNLGLVLKGCHRVLRPDGTAWVNLGDSYWGSRGGKKNTGKSVLPNENWPQQRPRDGGGLKQKDLVGIPWRFAFAAQGFAVLPASDLLYAADLLQEGRERGDWELVQAVEGMLRYWAHLSPFVGKGMYNRGDIIWQKPNPQPMPVKDRCTPQHEYIFLLSKSPRYYFDADAIAEPATALERYQRAVDTGETFTVGRHKARRGETPPAPMELLTRGAANVAARGTRNKRTVWEVDPVDVQIPANLPDGWDEHADLPPASVWKVATGGFSGPHYACYPAALIEPCILAGTSARGACPGCRAPWVRVTEGLHKKGKPLRKGEWEAETQEKSMTGAGGDGRSGRVRVGLDRKAKEEKTPVYRTIGWKPTCRCYDALYPALYPLPRPARHLLPELVAARWWRRCARSARKPGGEEWLAIPCAVLDPFSGMATTALAADRLGREGVGLELNPRDVALSRQRMVDDAPLLAVLSADEPPPLRPARQAALDLLPAASPPVLSGEPSA